MMMLVKVYNLCFDDWNIIIISFDDEIKVGFLLYFCKCFVKEVENIFFVFLWSYWGIVIKVLKIFFYWFVI